MFCLLKPLSIIYHMLVFLSAPSDVHRRVSHAANVGMWSHGYWALKKQKTHNLHRHLETTCSTCSNVDGKDRNDLRTRRTFQVPGTWFPPIFGAWNYHLYQLWPKKNLRHRFALHRGIAHVLKQPCVHCTWNHFWPERDDVQKFKHRRRAGSNFHREWLHLVHWSNEKVIVIWSVRPRRDKFKGILIRSSVGPKN